MASINVSSLTSSAYGSFDWQTMVDQLIAVDSTPIKTLQATEATNKQKLSSLAQLEADITTLQDSVRALSDSSLFAHRTTTASGTGWTVSAADGTANGTYTINVQNLATAAQLSGAADLASPLAPTSDVSGLTLAALPTATAVTAGTFTVNGKIVTVALTDSLQDVFDKISAATGGAVTAAYDAGTDTITLSGSGEVVLGSTKDSSNFLTAMRLANNGTASVTSSSSLGTVALNAPLASARLKTAITAVDASGNGSFAINGVTISYNVNTDSLATVLARINAADAGVTASFDSAGDRVLLTNTITGDIGVGVDESAGGLLGALGLTAGATLVHGVNAQFSVNGGPTLTSATNSLDGATFGVAGLTVQAAAAGTQTITVAADTAAMTTAIKTFIDQYNTVQSEIQSQTQISVDPTSGKVSTSILSDNHDIQNWSSSLRSRVFGQISSLTGSIKSLDNLGIGFNSAGTLSIIDSSKLSAALTNKTSDAAAFFNTASTGFAAAVNANLNQVLGLSGPIAVSSGTLNSQNNRIEQQIAALQTQLDRERAQLTAAFQAMQDAQNTAQTQMDYLTRMLKQQNSSNG